MKIVDFEQIKNLDIKPSLCVQWVENVFKNKYKYVLPSKLSIKLPSNSFFNTMPCYLPDIKRFGTKIVTRYPDRNPALKSEILLYNSENGNPITLMDGTWITAMRTGAVAALSIQLLQSSDANEYAFLGLGNTARATLLCLLDIFKDKVLKVRLLAYKNQEVTFMRRFKDHINVEFSIHETYEDLISDSDVVISCVTVANELFAPNSCYKPGVLVVPIHTRGFQNCDLFFDKVFADDKSHVEGFKYFDNFKKFDEISMVVLKNNTGRYSDEERILAYNIGIALHDIFFASKVMEILQERIIFVNEKDLFCEDSKFWV